MAVKQVLEWPHPILESRAQHVTDFDDTLQSLVTDMFDTMTNAHGIGLAANQIGVLLRVLIIKIGPISTENNEHKKNPALRGAPYEWENKLHVLINPTITAKEGKIRYDEGCLSFPDLYEEVERHKKITISYQDQQGRLCSVVAEDLFAICAQHEIDHLDGIVFVNRLKGRECQRAKKRFDSLKEKRLAKDAENLALTGSGQLTEP